MIFRAPPLLRRRRIARVLLFALALHAGFEAVLAPAFAGGPVTEASLRYDFFVYPDGNRRRDVVEDFFEGEFRLRDAITDQWSYRVDLRTFADDAHFTGHVVDPLIDERRRPYFDFPEAVLDWTPRSNLRLSAGRQIINWSAIDEIQPANLMTPLDESDLFRRQQVGAYALAGHWELEQASVDLAIVPAVFQPSRLPQGRWRFTPDGVGLHIDEPNVQWNETQAGLRVTTRLGSLDLAAVAYVGRDMFPLFTVDSSADPADGPAVLAHSSRTRAGGVTASYPVGESWLLRSEIVYYSSPDRDRDDFFQYVPLGAEYTRGNWRVVLNYLRYDRTSRGEGAVSQGERSFYPSFLFGETSWNAGGRWRARLRAGYDFQEEFALLEPEVSCRIWRDLRLGLSATVILAKSSSEFEYFDMIRHEDRLGLTLQYFH